MTTLIIGGHSGIGAAIYRADIGDTPIDLNDPNWSRPTQAELDVTNRESINNFLMESTSYFTRVVYCAGVNFPGMLGGIESSQVQETFDVNVIGFINLLDCMANWQAPFFRPTSIVAIVSDAATVAMRGSIAYCSSKAALAHAIRCAAREMAPNWRINGVAPGVVEDTPMTQKLDANIHVMRGWTKEHARLYERSLIPMQRRCKLEEVAQLTLSVLDGPKYLTGAVVPLTGGK